MKTTQRRFTLSRAVRRGVLVALLSSAVTISGSSTVRAETPYNLTWVRQLGTPGGESSRGVSVDRLGNVFISGDTSGSLGGVNAGLLDAFISKYTVAGNLAWTKQIGTLEYDISQSVSSDGLGNVYITGYTEGSLGGPNAGTRDAFVSKFDIAGNLIWSKQLGTASYDYSSGVSVDRLGNVFITGTTTGSLGGPNAGDRDAFVSKYDTTGNLVWTKQLGTSTSDESFGVSADGLGNIFISGHTWGSLGGQNATSTDTFISKYDAAGNLSWTKQFDTGTRDESYGVSADGLGNIYFTGRTGPELTNVAAFVNKIDGDGNLVWTQQLDSSSWDYSYGVSADGLGNVFITGDTAGSLGGQNSGNYDTFVSKYYANGNLAWTKQLGSATDDRSQSVSADGWGNVFISGYTYGSLQGQTTQGFRDAFVARYSTAITQDGGTLNIGGNGILVMDGVIAPAEPMRTLTNGATVSGAQGLVVGAGTQGNLLVISGGAQLTMTGNNSVLDIYSGYSVYSGNAYVGQQPGSRGTLRLTGSGSQLTLPLTLNIGWYGDGTLTVESGAQIQSGSGYMASSPGTSSTATISGVGSAWNMTGDFNVGYGGTATLTVSNGGTLSSSNGYVGYNAGSNGNVTVTGSGSSWNMTDGMSIGLGGSGSLTVSDAGTVSAGYGHIAAWDGSNGNATVTGSGSSWTIANYFIIGGDFTTNGGPATLTISNQGLFNGQGETILKSNSTVNLSGGEFRANTLSAQDGTAKIVLTGNNNQIRIGANSTFVGGIQGTGGFIKTGPGTLTLNNSNTFAGKTTVEEGSLVVQTSLPNNGPTSITIGAPDNTFDNNPSLTRSRATNDSYAGFGATSGNGLESTLEILAGTNVLGTDNSVIMQVRQRTLAEADTLLVSDVFHLSGMVNDVNLDEHQTDLFVLQMSYDPALLGDEAALVAARGLYLATYDEDTNQWVNAVATNIDGGMPTFVDDTPWNSSYLTLGQYGVDTDANVVWAVVNHNSEFAVAAIPEPSTLVAGALVALGLGIAGLRRRRTK